ncbi:MAG: MFS transporter [Clostridia bacterium]|nr:MFS transporter [Clostridia bacterium]
MSLGPKHTKRAAYIGYLTQALTINFVPLLFITFTNIYDISLAKISLLIAVSFTTQLLTDAFEAKFASRLNTRATIITAHILAVAGITGYAYLPDILPSHFLGLLICVVLSAVGAGIIEVLISPIVEACPTDGKSAQMSLLHSFYSWGQAAVVLLSTVFFHFIGIEHWRILSCLWAIIPALGAIAFAAVPIYSLEGDGENKTENTDSRSKHSSLLKSSAFVLFFILMLCAGAAEQAMSQWASTFAESGLGVSKAFGDLLGPCAFAILMGSARVIYAKFSEKFDLRRFIIVSSVLCVLSYFIAALSPNPVVSLVGCALCGFSVGIMWPGTYSLATQTIKGAGMRMFALLALGGDLGCVAGPSLAGWVAGFFGDDLKISFLLSAIFPLTIIVILLCQGRKRKNKTS